MSDKSVALLMKSAKRVPRGTAFIMSNGQLYMVNARMMMFDREGSRIYLKPNALARFACVAWPFWQKRV